MPQTSRYGVLTLVLLSICLCNAVYADRNHLGFGFDNDKEMVTLPFRSVNNLIVLETTIDDGKKLNLILDTGIRSLVLFNKSYVPKISEQTFQIQFTAAGMPSPLPADVSVGHTLRLSEDIVANQINAVILRRSNNNLHEIKGTKIHGIFGYQLFARFRVKIDFERSLITLSEPYNGHEENGFEAIPLLIHDTKPFIEIDALSVNNEWHHLNLILDLGANHKMLVHDLPETASLISTTSQKHRIADGLNGSILGYSMQLNQVKMGGRQFSDIEMLVPTKNTYHQESMAIKKHGSIGSKFFKNSTIIIDYINGYLFIEKQPDAFENGILGLLLKPKAGVGVSQ